MLKFCKAGILLISDPMSHRIIEKRRRDRMNNCLADLSRLIPAAYLKKFQGRGRIEKTEIIEMAIKHLKHLQVHSCKDPSNCEVAKNVEQERRRQFRLGFQESMSESIRFLVEIEGLYAGNGACMRLVNHLQKHYDSIVGGIPFGRDTNRIETQDDIQSETMDTESLTPPAPTTERLLIPNLQQDTKKEELQELKYEEMPQNSLETTSIVSSVNDTAMPHVSKGISQLREMLQNPGLPIERIRSNSYSTGSGNSINTLNPRPSSVALCTTAYTANTIFSHRVDEVYKFKNNIKDRFNADLQHLPESPLIEGKLCNDLPCANNISESKASASETFVVTTVSPSTPLAYRSDLSVKIPENSHSESGAISNGTWDHIDSSSSSSNPSPPGVGRSNGSSSGYSTGGEMSFIPKDKSQSLCQQTEPTSYINSVESLSGHSPSPPTSICNSGVPIFALHPKGTFYIPLTVDAALVAPYVDTFDDTLSSLHPISISVNFCRSPKPEYRIQRNLWQQANFYVNDRYANQCGSPERSSVTIPYTTMARN